VHSFTEASDADVSYSSTGSSFNTAVHMSQVSHTQTHTTVLLLVWNMSGTTRVSRYQKGKTKKVKTNLDLLEQEIVSGSGICWAVCKSAPHPRQPRQHPTTQFFTGWMPFLPPNQQHQSTEDVTVEQQKNRNFASQMTLKLWLNMLMTSELLLLLHPFYGP